MKKFAYILAALLFCFLACSREMEPDGVPALQEDGAPDGTVKVSFTCAMPDSFEDTKSLGEESGLTSMYLAVFGSSGYYKEYVQATLKRSYKGIKSFKDANGQPFDKEVDCYDFSVELKLSNTPRTIHFLGNGPKSIKIGKANDILPKLLCNDPDDESPQETAFWQMIWIPAIEAKTNGDGEYLNPQGNVRRHGEDYLVSETTEAYFQNIALIRNWAKISLRNNWKDDEPDYELDPSGQTYGFSNFEPHSFAIINYPTRGSFVPYGGKTGFIGPVSAETQDRHYELLGFDELYYSEKPAKATVEYPFYYGYKGNLPEGTPFNKEIPTAKDFENGTGGVKLYDRNYLLNMNPEARLDLHGLHQDEAQESLDRFITDCKARGLRKVLIIHGKGIHSSGSDPVLGELVRRFIEHDKRCGASGHPKTKAEGGSGATWVLLK